jgi:hypothetical protein
MKNDRCSKKFPKTYQDKTIIDAFGYTLYRRRNSGWFVVKGGVKLDSRSVVPYNMQLLKKYNAHINVEWCNKTHMIKYLFKYVTKGSDRARIYFELTANTNNASPGPQITPPNEIREYIDARYLSTCEALWQIFKFDIHFRVPSVERLAVHFLAKNIIRYEPGADLQTLLLSRAAKKTMLTEWFETNLKYDDVCLLTYCDFPKEWSWDISIRCWRRRRLSFAKIGCMYYMHPTAGELYYLRMLLMFVSGAMSFVDIRTFQNTVYETFREACEAHGLLEGDNEWNLLFDEAVVSASASQLRQLFVTIVVHCPVCNVRALFDKYWIYFTDDIHHGLEEALGNPHYIAPHEQLLTLLSRKLADTFANSGANIADYDLPILSACGDEVFSNRLIDDKLRAEPLLLCDHAAATTVSQLNADQRFIFEMLIESALSCLPGLFFVCGHGGTGKTFLWKAILTHLRSRQKIVLAAASSGVASLLLPKGCTAHSRFKIPFDLDESSVCGVKRGTMLSELIQRTSLVIWDEAPMTHRHCFEALDRTMCDILSEHKAENANKPFGGKPIVLGGDFRQILPVVRKSSRSTIVNASITSSPLWQHATVLKLRTNMRLSNPSLHGKERADMEQFSKWVLDISDGALPAVTRGDESKPTWVTIPEDLLIRTDGDAAASLISEVYPNLLERYIDPTYLATRAIVMS